MNDITLKNNEIALSVAEKIADVEIAIQALKAQQEAYKQRLTELMVEHQVKSIENDFVKITLVPETDKITLDSDKLKTEHEEVYLQCLRKTSSKAYVKIKAK
jgi:regulator of replication initiation timing